MFVAIIILFIVGCNFFYQNSISDLTKYEVLKTTDEIVQDDFIFRLVSEKGQYKEGERVKIYGEIEYAGDNDEVTIHHSSSAILFPIIEETRGYKIEYEVKDIGLSTVLKQGEPYRAEYEKSGGYSPDQDSKVYVKFVEDFLNRDDFPPGYYVMNGYTDFFVESEKKLGNQERFNIEATIDFKVVD